MMADVTGGALLSCHWEVEQLISVSLLQHALDHSSQLPCISEVAIYLCFIAICIFLR